MYLRHTYLFSDYPCAIPYTEHYATPDRIKGALINAHARHNKSMIDRINPNIHTYDDCLKFILYKQISNTNYTPGDPWFDSIGTSTGLYDYLKKKASFNSFPWDDTLQIAYGIAGIEYGIGYANEYRFRGLLLASNPSDPNITKLRNKLRIYANNETRYILQYDSLEGYLLLRESERPTIRDIIKCNALKIFTWELDEGRLHKNFDDECGSEHNKVIKIILKNKLFTNVCLSRMCDILYPAIKAHLYKIVARCLEYTNIESEHVLFAARYGTNKIFSAILLKYFEKSRSLNIEELLLSATENACKMIVRKAVEMGARNFREAVFASIGHSATTRELIILAKKHGVDLGLDPDVLKFPPSKLCIYLNSLQGKGASVHNIITSAQHGYFSAGNLEDKKQKAIYDIVKWCIRDVDCTSCLHAVEKCIENGHSLDTSAKPEVLKEQYKTLVQGMQVNIFRECLKYINFAKKYFNENMIKFVVTKENTKIAEIIYDAEPSVRETMFNYACDFRNLDMLGMIVDKNREGKKLF